MSFASTLKRLIAPAALPVLLVTLAGTAASPALASCPNEAVREQQGSTYLPECRGYEMVTPLDKNGQEVQTRDNYGQEIPFMAASEGSTVTYTLTGGIPPAEAGGLYGTATSESAAPGSAWSFTSLTDENAFAVVRGAGPRLAGTYQGYGRNLECGVDATRLPQAHLKGEPPMLPPDEANSELGYENLYMRDASTGEKFLVSDYVRQAPQNAPEGALYQVDGVSSDCQHVIFEAAAPEYDGSGDPTKSLYEWSHAKESVTGPVKVASVLPSGADATANMGSYGGSNRTITSTIPNLGQISRDGERVFFEARSDGAGPGEGSQTGIPELYVREKGEHTIEHTIEISAPQHGTNMSGDAYFEAASPEGSRVFFVGSYGLTSTTSAGKEAAASCQREPGSHSNGAGCDLYEYNFAANELRDLSPDAEGPGETGDKKGAEVRSVLGISSEGEYIYFTTSGQVEGKGEAEAVNETAAQVNVFAYHEGAVTFVGRIGALETYSGGEIQAVDTLWNDETSMLEDQARVSANGQYLLLVSFENLTGYNNTDAERHVPDSEYYEFHLGSPEPVCVSCNPSGEAPTYAPPTSQALLSFAKVFDGQLVTTLLDDGRVFFQSSDFLVPQAENAESGPGHTDAGKKLNVYEWRPLGVGECSSPTGDLAGCVGILDSGKDTAEVYYVGTNLDGDDAYLTTNAQLAPGIDTDGLRDMYDVRVDGGVLPPAPQGNCEESETCQVPSAGRRTYGHSSEAESGNGQVTTIEGESGVEAFITAKVAIAKHSTKGSILTLRLKVPGKGRLSVSGKGLIGAHKSYAKAGTYTLKLTLAAKGRAAVRHRRKVKVRISLSFVPSHGKASSTPLTVTFR